MRSVWRPAQQTTRYFTVVSTSHGAVTFNDAKTTSSVDTAHSRHEVADHISTVPYTPVKQSIRHVNGLTSTQQQLTRIVIMSATALQRARSLILTKHNIGGSDRGESQLKRRPAPTGPSGRNTTANAGELADLRGSCTDRPSPAGTR